MSIKSINGSPIQQISEADQWINNSDTEIGGNTDLTSEWARMPTVTFANTGVWRGGGMSESAGKFTFPSTGIYMIFFTICCKTAGTNFARAVYQRLKGTRDNFSSTFEINVSLCQIYNLNSSNDYGVNAMISVFECADITQDKIICNAEALSESGDVNLYSAATGSTTIAFLKISEI